MKISANGRVFSCFFQYGPPTGRKKRQEPVAGSNVAQKTKEKQEKDTATSAANDKFATDTNGWQKTGHRTDAPAPYSPPREKPAENRKYLHKKKRTDMKRNIIIGTLTAAVVLTLVFTCPGKKAHQAAIRNLITETLDEEPPEIIPQELLPVWNVLGSLAAGQLIDVLLDSQLEVRNYAIFSIGRIQLPDEKKTVSFGILGKIYTFDKEDIQKSWRKINQSGY